MNGLDEFEKLALLREVAWLCHRAQALFQKVKCCGTCKYWDDEAPFAKDCSRMKCLPMGHCRAGGVKSEMLLRYYHCCENYQLMMEE